MNSQVSELVLKNWFLANKDEYKKRRSSNDKELWDEQYKWDVFPKLNKELQKYFPLNQVNFVEMVKLLKKSNPSVGSFAHWIDIDDLDLLAQHPNGWRVIEVLLSRAEEVGNRINSASKMSEMLLHKKFSPSTYAYILCSVDCAEYAIHRDEICKELALLHGIEKIGKWTAGEKYKFLNDCCVKIAKFMAENAVFTEDALRFPALNGQDFAYVTIKYGSS